MPISIGTGLTTYYAPASAAAPSGPTFAFVAASTVSESANSATRTLSKPDGLVENDVLVAAIYRNSTILNTPSGWNLVQDGPGGLLHVWWKLCGASEPASWQWDFNAAGTIKGLVLGFSGASGITLDTSTDVAGSSTSFVLPSLTLATTNELLVAFCGNGGGRSFTEPSGMTELLDSGAGTANVSVAAYSQVVASAGATGTRTIAGTSSLTGDAIMLAVRGA